MLPQDPIELKVRELLSKGEKTEAIKFFKENSGLSFQESKSFVESIERGKNVPTSQQNDSVKNGHVEHQENKSSNQNKVVANFIELNKEKLPSDKFHELIEKMDTLESVQSSRIKNINLKNPTLTLILSILLGGYGVDRFYLKDYIFGSLKLIVTIFILLYWPPVYSIADFFEPEVYNIHSLGNFSILAQHLSLIAFLLIVYDVATSIKRTKATNYKTVSKAMSNLPN